MEEQTIERMVTRSFVSIRRKEPLLLSALGLFLAGLLWISSQALVGLFGAELKIPSLLFSCSLVILPLAPMVSPLALYVLSLRKQEEPLSIADMCFSTWRPSLALFLQSAAILVLEFLLAITYSLWSFVEMIPVFGDVIHLFFSWVPPCLALLMLLLLAVQVIGACFVGTLLVVHPVHAGSLSWSDLVRSFSHAWVPRLKLYLVGALPLLFLIAFFTFCGPVETIPQRGFAASFFRMIAFSFIYAPFFVFLSSMVVEAERFTIWRARNKS